MANPSKAKGTRQESAICKFVNEWAGDDVCERVALHGNRDEGDLRIAVDDLVLTGESKHCKSYPNEKLIEEFKRQTVAENENAGQDGGVLVVNLPGCGVRRYECWMQPATWLLLHGIDIGDDAPLHIVGRLRQLMEYDPHGWVRLTMADFCHLCFGPPKEES